jgi:quinol monooxygenase YgiN
MNAVPSDLSDDEPALAGEPQEAVVKALFVRLTAKSEKSDEVETLLRDSLAAVMQEEDTTTWYALRFGRDEFAIFDTFPGDKGRLAHLAGKVGRTLIARTPELFEGLPKIEHAHILAYKLPGESGQVSE